MNGLGDNAGGRAHVRPMPELIAVMRRAVAIQNEAGAAAAGAWLAEQTTDDEAATIMALWHLRHQESVPSAAALDFIDAVRVRRAQGGGEVSGLDDMPVGRRLDVEVLVRVFGFPRRKVFVWDWIAEAGGTVDTDPYYIPSGKTRRTHMADAVSVPYFSTRIEPAIALLERFWAWSVDHCDSTSPEFTVTISGRRGGEPFDASAHTLPEAACRAALRAVAGREGK